MVSSDEKNQLICFLPCRKGSQRVINKNTRQFCNYKFGLTEIKLNQLLSCDKIDKIIVSTDDQSIIDYADSLQSEIIETHRRSSDLSSSLTSTDDVIEHARTLISNGHILWTHVTSPFLSADYYSKIINQYFESIKLGYDSLMTVSSFQSFLWSESGPYNYNTKKEKWPRTQTLETLFEVNSAAFIASVNIYNKFHDRIGKKPFLYTLDHMIAFDIDWQSDFEISQLMLEKKIVSV